MAQLAFQPVPRAEVSRGLRKFVKILSLISTVTRAVHPACVGGC